MSLVIDASAWIDLLLQGRRGRRVAERLRGHTLHAPTHLDLEFLSAVGRLVRARSLTAAEADGLLSAAEDAPVQRHDLPALLRGAWSRRGGLRIADALYVELAHRLDFPLITTDQRLARSTTSAELVD